MLSIHTETERGCESLVLRRLEPEDRDRLAALFAGRASKPCERACGHDVSG
jgi:hypothetical protein